MANAIGMVEFNSMSRGIYSADQMVKVSEVEIVTSSQPGAHRREHRKAGVILGSDQFQGGALVGQLVADRLADPGLDLPNHVQQGPVSA